MPIKDRPEWQYLNEELCFDVWNEQSTLTRAQLEMERRNIMNPSTGEPPTRMGIRVAALRYAMNNPEEARRKIANAGGELGERRQFYRWLVDQAGRVVQSRSRYAEWVVENNLQEFVPGKYRNIIKDYEALVEYQG